MQDTTLADFDLAGIAWRESPAESIPTVSRFWCAVGAARCLLIGMPWITVLAVATWNGLVNVRNRYRCPAV